MSTGDLSKIELNDIQIERAGIYSLLDQLEISLRINFTDRVERLVDEVVFSTDWGTYKYSRLKNDQIFIEDLDRECGIRVDAKRENMTVWVKDEQQIDRRLWHELIRHGISAYLSDCGCTPIHAAAVVAPNGYTWMIAGQTHSGKSTLVLGLLAAGWQFLSDDSLILRAEDGQIVAYGWLGTSLLNPILIQTYPHLSDKLGLAVGERKLIDLKRCYPTQPVYKAQPQGLLFPYFSPDVSIAKLEPISSGTTLGNLMTHAATSLIERPQPHLVNLQQLAFGCEYFNLALGKTLQTQPALIAEVLIDHHS